MPRPSRLPLHERRHAVRAFLAFGAVGAFGSDGRRTTAFRPVDGERLLARRTAIPVRTWQYRTQAASTRHIGPTAQDFHQAFGVGERDTPTTGVDADGVALAGVQAHERRTRAQRAAPPASAPRRVAPGERR